MKLILMSAIYSATKIGLLSFQDESSSGVPKTTQGVAPSVACHWAMDFWAFSPSIACNLLPARFLLKTMRTPLKPQNLKPQNLKPQNLITSQPHS